MIDAVVTKIKVNVFTPISDWRLNESTNSTDRTAAKFRSGVVTRAFEVHGEVVSGTPNFVNKRQAVTGTLKVELVAGFIMEGAVIFKRCRLGPIDFERGGPLKFFGRGFWNGDLTTPSVT